MEGCLEFMWTFIAECIFAGFELAFVCLVQIGRNRWQKWFDLQQVPDRPQPFRMLECTRTLDFNLLICSLSIAPPSLFSSKNLFLLLCPWPICTVCIAHLHWLNHPVGDQFNLILNISLHCGQNKRGLYLPVTLAGQGTNLGSGRQRGQTDAH